MKKNKKQIISDFLSKFERTEVRVNENLAKNIEELELGEIKRKNGVTYVYIDNRKDIRVVNPDDTAIDNLLDWFYNKGIALVKESIAGVNSVVLENIKRPKLKVIKELRPHISGEDYGALSFAYGIIKMEDKGEDAIHMHKQMFDSYKARGVRIYSLLRSGILEHEIWPLIKDMKKEDIKKKFDEIISSPPGIFVGGFMKKHQVLDKIHEKFNSGLYQFPIFARAGRVGITIQALKELEEKDKNIAFLVEKDTRIGENDAVTITVLKLDKI